VHRIGRTGRAQAVGDAFTLVTPENAGDVRDIERFIGQKIPELRLEGFEYRAFVARAVQPQQQRRHQHRPQRRASHGNRSGSAEGERGQPQANPGGKGGATPQQRKRAFWGRR
jgi:ATP-dependent RNA helicase RhlE